MQCQAVLRGVGISAAGDTSTPGNSLGSAISDHQIKIAGWSCGELQLVTQKQERKPVALGSDDF